MSLPYQCPKCAGRDFILVAPAFEVRTPPLWRLLLQGFLGPSAPFRARSGFLVRCTRHGCGRDWVLTSRGFDEPADRAVPGGAFRAGQPVPRPELPEKDADKNGKPRDAWDAVERPSIP